MEDQEIWCFVGPDGSHHGLVAGIRDSALIPGATRLKFVGCAALETGEIECGGVAFGSVDRVAGAGGAEKVFGGPLFGEAARNLGIAGVAVCELVGEVEVHEGYFT